MRLSVLNDSLVETQNVGIDNHEMYDFFYNRMLSGKSKRKLYGHSSTYDLINRFGIQFLKTNYCSFNISENTLLNLEEQVRSFSGRLL